jgi:hypothetical protein
MGIPNDWVFSSKAKAFFIEQCLWFPNEDFLWILRQGTGVFACSAKIKFPDSLKNSKDSHPQAKRDHHNTNIGIKISLFIAEISNIPSTN